MNKKIVASTLVVASMFTAQVAFAHATVKPAEVGLGKFQTFTLGVPTEKEIPTVAVRLVVPDGVAYVSPNVKPGWKIATKKTPTGNQVEHDGMVMAEEKVSEIEWTGGSIPEEQRDEFLFSLQVPSTATELQWKVYQTYADGSVMSWDADPKAEQPKDANGKPDFSKTGPYSKTAVVDDLAAKAAPAAASTKQSNSVPLSLSIVALALSAYSLVRSRKA